jgi:hypothetical protein
MERVRRRFGMVGVVSLTAVLALGACGDDESATDQVCDARTSLRDSVETVTGDISDGNFGDAQDALPDVRDSYDELVSSLEDLTDEQRADIQPTVDSLRSTIEGLPEAGSLEDLGSDLESVTSDVQSIYDSITQSLECS